MRVETHPVYQPLPNLGIFLLELYSWTQESSYFMLLGESPMSPTASGQSSCQ